MQFDLTGAVEQIQRMVNAFLARLPYLAVALPLETRVVLLNGPRGGAGKP